MIGSVALDTYEPDDHVQEPFEPSLPPKPEIVTPLEELNPWVSIIYRPRDTIRYVLDTGQWSNIWVLAAIIFFGVMPGAAVAIYNQYLVAQLQPGPGVITSGVFYIGIIIAQLILGYPLTVLFIYINGWLNRLVGSWLDGQGTNRELRITGTWTSVFQLYGNWVMLAPNCILAFYYTNLQELTTAIQIAVGLGQFAIALPFIIAYFVIGSKCIGEAHRFSAWRGLGTIIISFMIMMAVMMVPIFILFGIIFAIAIL